MGVLERLRGRLTRGEILAGAGLFLIAAGICTAAGGWYRQRVYRRTARQGMQEFVKVLSGSGYSGSATDRHFSAMGDIRYGKASANAALVEKLYAGEGGFARPDVWRRGSYGLDADGNFLDPWGNQYQVVLDGDGDGFCSVRVRGRICSVETGAVVWSCGPDGVSGTGDDIRSW